MHPQVRAFIEMLKANIPADAPKMWQLTPQQAREQNERFYAPFNEGGPQAAEVRDLRFPGRRSAIPARLYVPRGAAALRKAGVSAELQVYEDGIHAFLQVPTFDMTRDALAKIAAFGRTVFGITPP